MADVILFATGCGAYPFCGLAAAAAALWGGAAAQSSSSSCTSELINMSLCLNYITGSSSEPSSSCCQQLASVVKSQCLCAALNGVGCQWGSMSTKIRLWPFVLLAVLRLLPLVVAVIFKMNSYINPFFGANHRGGNGCHLQKANESFHIGFCYLPRNAMINRLTVVWKPTCFYASKHFLSLSGCLVSGECLKAVQQREKFMRKFKRAALWKRLHERNAKHVLSSMIELEGFWGPKEVICHGFNRVQPDLLIVGSWCLSPFPKVNGVAQLHGDILKAELFAHGLSRIKPIALLLVDGSDFAVLSSAIPSPNG